jgi:hypothetical protein
MSKKKGTNATVAVRQQAALEYRISGFTYRQIASQLGVSEKTAYYDVQGSIDNIEAIKSAKAEQIREMELMRLDRMTAALNKAANAGDVRAIGQQVRIMERRSKMLGLDAAIQVKQEIAANDGKPFVFTMQFNNDADSST